MSHSYIKPASHHQTLRVLLQTDSLQFLFDFFSRVCCHDENLFHVLSQHVARVADILRRLCLKTAIFSMNAMGFICQT